MIGGDSVNGFRALLKKNAYPDTVAMKFVIRKEELDKTWLKFVAWNFSRTFSNLMSAMATKGPRVAPVSKESAKSYRRAYI